MSIDNVSSSNISMAMPKVVKIAVFLQLISLLILGPLISYYDWDNITAKASISMIVTIDIIVIAVLVWFVYKIAQGRNWARIVLLIMFALGILPSILIIPQKFEYSVLLGLLMSLQFAIQLISLCLLFIGSGSLYFEKK